MATLEERITAMETVIASQAKELASQAKELGKMKGMTPSELRKKAVEIEFASVGAKLKDSETIKKFKKARKKILANLTKKREHLTVRYEIEGDRYVISS